MWKCSNIFLKSICTELYFWAWKNSKEPFVLSFTFTMALITALFFYYGYCCCMLCLYHKIMISCPSSTDTYGMRDRLYLRHSLRWCAECWEDDCDSAPTYEEIQFSGIRGGERCIKTAHHNTVSAVVKIREV